MAGQRCSLTNQCMQCIAVQTKSAQTDGQSLAGPRWGEPWGPEAPWGLDGEHPGCTRQVHPDHLTALWEVTHSLLLFLETFSFTWCAKFSPNYAWNLIFHKYWTRKGVGVNKKRYNQCAVQRAGRPSCDKMKLGKIQVAQNCQKNEAGKTRTSWWFVIKLCIIISFITMSCECISKEDRVVWGITVTVAGNSTFSLFTTNRVISPLLPRPCKTPIAKCFSFSQK